MSSSHTPSSSPTSSMPVSLPSIHEMFPDHLMRKDVHFHDSEHSRSYRGHIYPESPGIHHLHHRHRVSEESHCGCNPPSQYLPTNSDVVQVHSHAHHLSQQHPHETPADKKRPPTANPSQSIYAFNVLRSSPTSSSLLHITSSATLPNRPANPQQLGCHSVVASGSSPAFRISVPSSSFENERHGAQDVRRERGAMPPRMSSSISEGGYAAVSSPRTRASAGIDPYPAINSFPLSRPGPLPSAPSKHNQHYPSHSPGPASGVNEYEPSHTNHGTFHTVNGVLRHGTNLNDEEDDGVASGADDNDTSNGKKHICPTCFKRFNRPSSLRIHVNTHTGATPFRCPWPNCGREFNVNSNMRRHYRNHTTPGFSRSQNSSNPNGSNPQLNDGRRKRRRVSAPQIPLPPSATAPSAGPASHSYPLSPTPYRTDYHHKHPPAPHNYSHNVPYPAHHAHSHNPHTHLQHPGSTMPSPSVSNLSVSDEDSSSCSDSDMDEDTYPAPRSRQDSKEEEDELLEYEPDASSLRYRTVSLTQSLARVAVAPTNGMSRRGHPYGLYNHAHTLAYGPNDHAELRRGSEHGYGHPNGHPRRPPTPGSSFHSSSPSPSISPSPPPPPPPLPSSDQFNLPSRVSAQSNYKYSASTPYVRSLTDSRVSTTLRPAFGNSSERHRTW